MQNVDPPTGGLAAGKTLRPWRWRDTQPRSSERVRCRGEQGYLIRAVVGATHANHAARAVDVVPVMVRFERNGEPLRAVCVPLAGLGPWPFESTAKGEAAPPPMVLRGWTESPAGATHVSVELIGSSGVELGELVLHPVADRDPKCHPLANVPRWSTMQPPFAIRRVFLPESMSALAQFLPDMRVEAVRKPGAVRRFAREVRGAACIVDPDWVLHGRWSLADVELLAASAWVIVDLGILARLLVKARAAETEARQYHAVHEIMSARVAYSDVPTRGFALQDVLPYGAIENGDRFTVRVLRRTASWKKYAGESGFAALLTSETPWVHKCGDVLSAARAIGSGELIATDVPWLLLGAFGRPLAPRLLEHLFRMHLGAPCPDHLQYWNTWDDTRALVRDIADLRRYGLQPVRWRAEGGEARLGLTLVGPAGASEPGEPPCHLVIDTGRIDARGVHDGLRAEPMVIFMKQLAREVREQTAWAHKHLAGVQVTWRFAAADAVYYATAFEAASELRLTRELRLRGKQGTRADMRSSTPGQLHLPEAVGGIFGDGSLRWQDLLTRTVRRWIERQ